MSAPIRLPFSFDVAQLERDLASWDEDFPTTTTGKPWWSAPALSERRPCFAAVFDALRAAYPVAFLLEVFVLEPGASFPPHRDLNRKIHVPILTNPDAVLTLDGVEHRWQPGEAWLGDFGLPHEGRNLGPTRRVHLLCMFETSGRRTSAPWAERETYAVRYDFDERGAYVELAPAASPLAARERAA